MKIVKIEDLQSLQNPHGVDARKVHENTNVQIVHICLKPGEMLIKHETAVDVSFFILEGEGEVEIGDKKVLVSENTLVDSPKDLPHCLYNNGTADFRVLVIKTPAPTIEQTKTAIERMRSVG